VSQDKTPFTHYIVKQTQTTYFKFNNHHRRILLDIALKMMLLQEADELW
jgi:hypothetical protein